MSRGRSAATGTPPGVRAVVIRTRWILLRAVAVLVLAVALIVVIREQRQQAAELSQLSECVSILQRNQAARSGDALMGCPIYN